jgi:hypothetical protein
MLDGLKMGESSAEGIALCAQVDRVHRTPATVTDLGYHGLPYD